MIKPFFIHRDTLAVLSLYKKNSNIESIFFEIDHISTDEDWKTAYEQSAKCLIDSFENHHCRAFLYALRDELNKRLKDHEGANNV